ncbi:hypothetical protein MC885_013833, partial [Smutsia gigantea]
MWLSRVLSSYWVGEDSIYKLFELSEEILTPSESPNQPTSTGRCRADICRPQEPWPWKGPQVPPHYWWSPTTTLAPSSLEKVQCSPAPPLLLIQ